MYPDDPRTIDEDIQAGDLVLRVRRPPSAEDLIDEGEFDEDERLPYWAEVWPSGRVLASALATLDLTGLGVLELGAGLGTGAMIAAHRGARAMATDWYPDAVEFCRWNAHRQGVDVTAVVADWRHPPSTITDGAPWDLIIAADVLYEARNGTALGLLIPRLVGPASRVIIADPRRPDARPFIDAMTAAGWSYRREDLPVPGRVDESGPIVYLHHFAPPLANPSRPVVV